MAYNANIPVATDAPSTSQPQMLANFQEINAAFNLNHQDFNLVGVGKHKFINFPEQAAAPAIVPDEINLYSRLSALTNIAELCVKKEDGTINEFTNYTTHAGGAGIFSGWTRLPSGILLKWGQDVANGSTVKNFYAAADVPAFTNIFAGFTNILVTNPAAPAVQIDVNAAIRLCSWTNTTYTVYAGQRTAMNIPVISYYSYFFIGI